ncbi:Cpe/LpqF family protein [Actinotalea subterranea]|uniref:Cpe/LpqF family protein n=1 Tax=Actinotalea subterranea TaxID=2607497 RepID=UPI0011EE9615|nr:Cpe/LpqF family protein [Actinotalea subterranea]
MTTGGRHDGGRPGRDVRWRNPGAAAVTTACTFALLAGCTGGGDASGPSPTAPVEDAAGPAVDLPDDDAGRQAAWVLETLAGTADVPEDEIAGRFSEAFLAEVPADQLNPVFTSLRAAGPWTLASVETGPGALLARLDGQDGSLDMELAVDPDGRIAGLLFTPAAPPRDRATSWGDLSDEVAALPGSTSLYVARVEDGRCVPVDGMPAGNAAGESLPVGSIVKLYVLGAVVDAVEDGRLAWDTELTLTDDLRSLPSGNLQDEPAGAVITVQAAASDMIAISDNTATDLLVHAVGRDAVEQALTDMGHGDPARNVPLATTRELFQLGWGGGEDLRGRWRDADAAGREEILAALPGGAVEIDEQEIGAVAAWPYGVDWFATGADLCAAHVALAQRAATGAGEPVREILSANPGIEVDDAWEHVAFKGGSSVGTMAGAWLAEPVDGGVPVVVVMQAAATAPQEALPAQTLVGIAEDALALTR